MYKSQKTVVKILNRVGIAVAIWLFFYPANYALAIVSCVSIPVISILIVLFFKGAIRIGNNPNFTSPSVFLALAFPSGAMVLRAILDFNIFDYSKIWFPCFLISFITPCILLVVTKEYLVKEIKHLFTLFAVPAILAAYGYGAIVLTNCYFDSNYSRPLYAEVLQMNTRVRKTVTYKLKIKPLNKQFDQLDALVFESLYDRINVGDTVVIHLKSGKLDIPWYTVSK